MLQNIGLGIFLNVLCYSDEIPKFPATVTYAILICWKLKRLEPVSFISLTSNIGKVCYCCCCCLLLSGQVLVPATDNHEPSTTCCMGRVGSD